MSLGPDVANARKIVDDLGGQWRGTSGTAPCPVCQPERRRDQHALSIAEGADGRILLHCFKSDCGYAQIAAAVGSHASDVNSPAPAKTARREEELRGEVRRKADQARRIWREAQSIAQTPAERYLREARCIRLDRWPTSLRYHPGCWHGPTARRWPALVALVERADLPALHRTFIMPDGDSKAGLEGGDKLMLGRVAGGAVRLTYGSGPLLVGEGLESTLSAFLLHGDAKASAWAALSTSGMIGLRLPDIPGRLTIAPDGDKAGRGAALTLANRAAREGWTVSMLTPPPGGDFNDLLRDKVM